jgi:hypothetical protein
MCLELIAFMLTWRSVLSRLGGRGRLLTRAASWRMSITSSVLPRASSQRGDSGSTLETIEHHALLDRVHCLTFI